jgi:hypothetical protein
MANGTWYRGEGVNIPPAQAGKMTHDLADGLYFADTLDGAKPFARRAPDPADQRLYQVKVDLSSMTVLNLSTDKRWENYMKEPVSPAGGWSRGDFLKQMPAAEHYNDFFTAFVKANKIDLNKYDAVIGPLFQAESSVPGSRPSAVASWPSPSPCFCSGSSGSSWKA